MRDESDPDEVGREAGRKLGQAIISCFDAIATLEGIPYHEAVDQWVGAYLAERVRQQAAEQE